MKLDIHPNLRKFMVDLAGSVSIPDLSTTSHKAAHENFTQRVIAGTLRSMLHVPKTKAERLAAIYDGCPRVRLATIIRREGL